MSGVGITGKIVPLNNGSFSVFDGQPVANLATLSNMAGYVTGSQVFVVDQNEFYQLDTANTFTLFSPLIIAAFGGGRWFRRSKAYVVANYTMWCQAYGTGAVGFTPGQLTATATVTPDIQLVLGSFNPSSGQQDLVIDNLGNIWVTFNPGSPWTTPIKIRKFLLKDCLASGTPTKAVEITLPVADSEAGCTIFDRDGALWSNNGTHGAAGTASFLRFGQKAYQHDDAVADVVVVSQNTPSTSNIQYMIFDGNGNLWASMAHGNNGAFNGGIIMFTRAQLVASATGLAPSVYWTGTNFAGSGSGLAATCGLALDSLNKLWVGSIQTGDNKIRAWQTVGAASGNPAPDIILSSASFSFPYTVAFDPAGNLWTQNATDNKLLRIPKASLSVTGTVVPDIIVTSTVALGNIVFPNNPDKSGLLPSGFP